jgi:hypothetical protein
VRWFCGELLVWPKFRKLFVMKIDKFWWMFVLLLWEINSYNHSFSHPKVYLHPRVVFLTFSVCVSFKWFAICGKFTRALLAHQIFYSWILQRDFKISKFWVWGAIMRPKRWRSSTNLNSVALLDGWAWDIVDNTQKFTRAVVLKHLFNYFAKFWVLLAGPRPHRTKNGKKPKFFSILVVEIQKLNIDA